MPPPAELTPISMWGYDLGGTLAHRKATADLGVFYVTSDTNQVFHYDGAAWQETARVGSDPTFGDITADSITVAATFSADTTADKVGFFTKAATPVVQQAFPGSAANTITSAGSGIDNAIQALTNSSPFGFVNAAEGESALRAIVNNQSRLNAIQTALINIGILAFP